MSTAYADSGDQEETWLFSGEDGFLIHLKTDSLFGVLTLLNIPNDNSKVCRVKFNDDNFVGDTSVYQHDVLILRFESHSSMTRTIGFQAVIVGVNTSASREY